MPDAFKQLCLQHDLLITSYTLARKDSKLLGALHWWRVVLDERKILKTQSRTNQSYFKTQWRFPSGINRYAGRKPLNGFMVTFYFLNPGYLGKQAHFAKPMNCRYSVIMTRDSRLS